MLSYYAAKLLSRIICLMPHTCAIKMGDMLAHIFWRFVPQKRKALAREQIMRCLGVDADEANRIARKSGLRFGPMLMEVLRFPVMKAHMADYVTIVGAVDDVRSAIAAGKGAIFATSHSGNWELMGGAFACAGFPLVGVAKQQKSSGMDRFINEYRALIGMHITYRSGVREMFRMMKEGWVVGLLADQDTNKHDGIVLDFFGKPTNCVPGPAAMARSAGLGVIPGFITRKEDGTHKIILYAPVEVPRTKDKRADIRTAEQAVNRVLEQHIREHPEEWFWLHDRWKSMREEF